MAKKFTSKGKTRADVMEAMRTWLDVTAPDDTEVRVIGTKVLLLKPSWSFKLAARARVTGEGQSGTVPPSP